MMKRKIGFILSAVLLCGLMIFSTGLFAGCNPDEPKEAKITDGIYVGNPNNDPSGLICYIVFKTDNTYYGAYFADAVGTAGGVNEAGTYEVKDGEIEYYADYDFTEGATNTKVKANQYVELKPYGKDSLKIAYVDGKLYDAYLGGMSNHVNLKHDTEYEWDEAKEMNITILKLYNDNDADQSLTLYHTKKFVDFTGSAKVEGTWAEEKDGSYKLTAGSNTYTIAKKAGETKVYTYTKSATDSTELTTYILTDEPTYEFKATANLMPIGEGAFVTGDIYLQIYADDSVKVILTNISMGPPPTTVIEITKGKVSGEMPFVSFKLDSGTAGDTALTNGQIEIVYNGTANLPFGPEGVAIPITDLVLAMAMPTA